MNPTLSDTLGRAAVADMSLLGKTMADVLEMVSEAARRLSLTVEPGTDWNVFISG
jgi:hypothetical protein